MQAALYFAALLATATGVAHSLLGERYILTRLARREDLPRIMGSAEFTMQTLRFAWHVTSIAWWGFAAILVQLAHPPLTVRGIGLAIGLTFIAHFLVALFASRGRHLSWIAFLLIGAIATWVALE